MIISRNKRNRTYLWQCPECKHEQEIDDSQAIGDEVIACSNCSLVITFDWLHRVYEKGSI